MSVELTKNEMNSNFRTRIMHMSPDLEEANGHPKAGREEQFNYL